MKLLCFDKVGVVLGGVRILDEVTIAIAASERVAVVADSGAGKSVFVRLALGFLAPTSGVINLFDCDIGIAADAAVRVSRARCGIALQGGSLFAALTVEDNLRIALGRRTDGTAARRRIDRLLVDFRIEQLSGCVVGALSTGEQRRVELARAFVRDPELVVLDEPFDGAMTQREALEVQVRRHVIGRRRAMLLVTQDIALARRLAERCYLLEAGRLMQLADESAPVAAS